MKKFLRNLGIGIACVLAFTLPAMANSFYLGDLEITGDVGIGATPTKALHVEISTSDDAAIFKTSSGETGLRTEASGTNDVYHFFTNGSFDAEMGMDGTTGSYYFEAPNGTKRMVIEQDGEVGIGIEAPTSALHIYGTDGDSSLVQIERYSNDAFAGALTFWKDRAGAAVVSGDNIAYIDGYGYDGTADYEAFSMNVEASENWSVGNHGSEWTLGLIPTGEVNPTDVFAIDGDGVTNLSGAGSFDSESIIYLGDQLNSIGEYFDDSMRLWSVDRLELTTDDWEICLGTIADETSSSDAPCTQFVDTLTDQTIFSDTNSESTTTDVLVDFISTDMAVRLPNMTTTQRNAITASQGMTIQNTTDDAEQYYDGTRWVGLNPYNLYFQAYDSAGGTTIDATGAAVPLATESFKDSEYTHSTVTNNSRVTVATTGLYEVSYNVTSNDSANRHSIVCFVRKNGSATAVPSRAYNYGRGSDSVDDATVHAEILTSLTANDYIEIFCQKASSAATDPTLVANESWIKIERIR